MKSDKWPIEVEGREYHVERTFGGDPAIYLGNSRAGWRHISDDPRAGRNQCPLPTEDVIIIECRVNNSGM